MESVFSLQNWNQKLEKWGLFFPATPKPLASYVPYVISGDLIYTSGALPLRDGKLVAVGFLGQEYEEDLNVEVGQQAARWAVLNALAAVVAALSGFTPQRHLDRIVQLTGYVQSRSSFHEQHLVMNGASDLLVELLGEAGRHTRIAIGTSSLPLEAPVEISLIAQMRTLIQG